jgi:hypothetical protein
VVVAAIVLAALQTPTLFSSVPYAAYAISCGFALAYTLDACWERRKTNPLTRQRVSALSGLLAANLLVAHFYHYSLTNAVGHNPTLHSSLVAFYARMVGLHPPIEPIMILGIAIMIGMFTFLFSQRLFEGKGWEHRHEAWEAGKYLLVAGLLYLLIRYLGYRATDILFHLKAIGLWTVDKAHPEKIRSLPLMFLAVSPVSVVGGALTFQFAVGIAGRLLSPYVREGTMRTITFLYRYTAAWMLLCVLTFVGPLSVSHVLNSYTALAVTVGAVLVLSLTYRLFSHAQWVRHAYIVSISQLFGYVILLCFACLLSYILSRAVLDIDVARTSSIAALANLWRDLSQQSGGALALTIATLTVLTFSLSIRFGINSSSMHLFYQARVMRAFLDEALPGVERLRTHSSHPATLISQLQSTGHKSSYTGPYFLINAALNLVRGDDTAWQERLATNFVFSPIAFGYSLPGQQVNAVDSYVASSELTYAGEKGLRLGHAMAVSGSALSSNMGVYTSSLGRFLHTIFNLRLGWWFPNSRVPASIGGHIPRSRVRLMWDELMGKTSADGAYVYLSDGGHFENLGVYELVRRRCKVIILSDASTDSDSCLRSLGNAIERCRVDLGTEILLNVMPEQGGAGLENGSRIGDIQYADGERGIICYLKQVIISSAPLDAHAYKRRDPMFPHHPITDQWFGESQFESYRVTGRCITDCLCRQIIESTDAGTLFDRCCRLSRQSYPDTQEIA